VNRTTIAFFLCIQEVNRSKSLYVVCGSCGMPLGVTESPRERAIEHLRGCRTIREVAPLAPSVIDDASDVTVTP
jgi:hypothetical protein